MTSVMDGARSPDVIPETHMGGSWSSGTAGAAAGHPAASEQEGSM